MKADLVNVNETKRRTKAHLKLIIFFVMSFLFVVNITCLEP